MVDHVSEASPHRYGRVDLTLLPLVQALRIGLLCGQKVENVNVAERGDI